jgi:hypothetical protein
MGEIFSAFLSEIVVLLATALAGLLGTLLSFGLKRLEEYLKVKLSKETYEHALEVAKGVYVYLEDKYGDAVESMGITKKQEMEAMLLDKFPSLTQLELDSINKAVWESFNNKFTYPSTSEAVKKIYG